MQDKVQALLVKSSPRRQGSASQNNESNNILIAFIAQTLMVTIITVFAIIYFNQDTEPIPATNHNAKEITEFII